MALSGAGSIFRSFLLIRSVLTDFAIMRVLPRAV